MSWLSEAAEVFSALGTVGAFGVTLVLLRKEQQREAARSEDERRAQAEKVSAWMEMAVTSAGGRDLQMLVHNASDMPIYEVSLSTLDEDDEEAGFIALVPPGQTASRPAPDDWIDTYLSPEPLALQFTDSAGQRWTRNESGALSGMNS